MVSIHLFFTKANFFNENVRFCMILDGPYKSGVAELCPFVYFSQKNEFFYESIRFCMILVCSQDIDSMNHTSQEWLNGVHLSMFSHTFGHKQASHGSPRADIK